VVLEPEQEDRLLDELWQGRPEPQPLQADGAWLEGIPLADQPGLRQRWQDLRLRLWLENHYAQALEVRFEQRRAALDRVVLSLIRLDSHEVAEELYLRLLDDGADFGQLAREYSLGEERHTCGLIGPVPIGQLHQELQRLITTLAAGVVHPPLPVDGLVVLVKLEQRLPAELGGNLRQQLLEELFEADLEATLEAFLPSDQAADAPRELPAGGAA
jgi:parvulin-like peptidyl-prolyl isomerase